MVTTVKMGSIPFEKGRRKKILTSQILTKIQKFVKKNFLKEITFEPLEIELHIITSTQIMEFSKELLVLNYVIL